MERFPRFASAILVSCTSSLLAFNRLCWRLPLARFSWRLLLGKLALISGLVLHLRRHRSVVKNKHTCIGLVAYCVCISAFLLSSSVLPCHIRTKTTASFGYACLAFTLSSLDSRPSLSSFPPSSPRLPSTTLHRCPSYSLAPPPQSQFVLRLSPSL